MTYIGMVIDELAIPIEDELLGHFLWDEEVTKLYTEMAIRAKNRKTWPGEKVLDNLIFKVCGGRWISYG